MACGSLCSQTLFSRFPVSVSASFSTSSSPRRAVTVRTSAARLPVVPLNPKDPFLSKLASVAASHPEALAISRKDSDTLPYVDLLGSPKLMATSDQLERSTFYRERRPRTPPPDLPSLLLSGRIVYLGMPMVPAVTELVVAQLLYLQWMDPMEPIYIYINSTGTTRDDGEPVAMEAQGLAIYDVLMRTKSDIHTLCLGVAAGQACLLLAAGKKGKRFMMPNSYAIIQQPRIPSYGMMQASDIAIRAKEVLTNRDTLVQLLAKHTGNPTDAIHHIMRRVRHMNAKQAIEYGVIDKILQHDPPPKTLKEIRPRKEWNRIDTRLSEVTVEGRKPIAASITGQSRTFVMSWSPNINFDQRAASEDSSPILSSPKVCTGSPLSCKLPT